MEYTITVNGSPVAQVNAESRDAAINKWLIDTYGSVLSSSAPYNVSANITTD